jgi:hypothetical protein
LRYRVTLLGYHSKKCARKDPPDIPHLYEHIQPNVTSGRDRIQRKARAP